MSVLMESRLWSVLDELRYQPVLKRVRAAAGGAPVLDSERAVLVWEPKRVVPSYAVPAADVRASLHPPTEAAPPVDVPSLRFGDGPPVLDPSVPFAVHSAPGEDLDVDAAGHHVAHGAFRLAVEDPALADHVVFDFDGFDWLEEDEPVVSHPRDPFHRIDVLSSARTVRIEHHGTVLAESNRCQMLFEGTFPMPRYYLPRDDVAVALQPGTLHTVCAYKGAATHWSAVAGDERLADIAWSYEDPLDDAVRVRSMIAFYQERLDVFVDGAPVGRVRTPWS
jgi:uncharacterized protein (DUF427 family)